MRHIYKIMFFGVLLSLGATFSIQAQNVRIEIPAQNIFNHSEFNTVETVMNTQGSSNWRAGAINPSIWSTSGNNFVHRGTSGLLLPTSVLHWRLASIGGQTPPFHWRDSWPGYKWFTPSEQTWYQPSIFSSYTRGNIDFSFKIPSNEISQNTFIAGEYLLSVTHNYGYSWWYSIEFTPDSFYVTLSVPWAMSWLTANNSVFAQINSLNEFKSAPAQVSFDLGDFDLGHTIGFRLFAKSDSPDIRFTSSKGVQETRNISLLKLGSNDPRIITSPLTSTNRDFTPGSSFEVKNGNRNNFNLKLSLSKADFKNYFYAAGTYKFQINLDAQSTDNSISAQQNVDFTLDVLPLSEITIPNSGNDVNFEFNTASHYQNGQSKTIPNQLRISNNETYELYVKSDVPYFKKSGIQSDVPSTILKVGVIGGSQEISLSTTSQKLIANGTPILDKKLDVKYTIPPDAAQTLVAKEKNTYSINVIYSFTAI